MAFVPFRRLATDFERSKNPRDWKRVGTMVDRNFEELAFKSPEVIIVSISNEGSALTTGTAKMTFRMPYSLLVERVKASVTATSSSGVPTFDINCDGDSILGTKLTVDVGEETSSTADDPATIIRRTLPEDSEITVDIDTAGTGTKGAKVYLIGHRTR